MMVSTQIILHTVMVIMSAAAVTAAPQGHFGFTPPSLPRIPSAAKHLEVLEARAPEADSSAVVQATCLDAEQ